MSQAESITNFLFGKMGVNTSSLEKEIDNLIDHIQKYPELIPIYPLQFLKHSGKQMIMLQR